MKNGDTVQKHRRKASDTTNENKKKKL